MNRKSYSFVILASERCSDYLCDFAATGFVLDPAGNSGAGIYCERCGRKMVAEYCEKVEPGWTFHPGKIHGDLRSVHRPRRSGAIRQLSGARRLLLPLLR